MPGRPPQGRPPQGVICRMQPTLAPCPGACHPSACLQVKRRSLAPLALAVAFERHGAGFAEALVATAGAKGDRGQRRPVAPKNAQQRHGPAASHRALIEQGPGDSVHPIWSHYPQSAVPACLPITSPAAPPPARPSSARSPSLSSCYQLRALTISRSRVFSGPARAGVSALSDLCFRISCYSMVLLNSEPPIANRRRRSLAYFDQGLGAGRTPPTIDRTRAWVAVRIAPSASGANSGEWLTGTALPAALSCAITLGSYPPIPR